MKSARIKWFEAPGTDDVALGSARGASLGALTPRPGRTVPW